MKSSKHTRFAQSLALAALAGVCAALPLSVQADVQFTWTNPGVGDWNNPANWTPGVPVDSGDWDIATINNGGTAVLSLGQPGFNEVQVGNSGLAGNLTINSGGALTNNNWLVIGRTGAGGNTPMSTLIVEGTGRLYKTGDGFIVGDGTFCYGQVIVKDSAQVIISGGWNGIGNGNGGVGYLTLQDNAVYTLANQDWNIGDWGSGRGFALIKDNATLNVSRFWIGKNDTSFGVVKQTGGAIVGNNNGANEWCIGGENGGATAVYGFYELSGGTFSNPNNFQIGRNGMGVIYQSGGSISASSWTAIGRFATASGLVWVSGGTFSHIGTGTELIVGENGRGQFDLTGGTLDCNLRLRVTNPGGTGIVNLNGGTARVPAIGEENGASFVNFNGGTVQAKASNPSFMSGLTEAVVHSGSAIFDTAGNDISIEQALVAPTGNGVQNIPIADGGSGYLAPPLVQIDSSGFGAGATAVAQINPATGVLTNILVTSSGYGYSSAPFVNLVGGAPTTPASLNTTVLAPAASGGLIKNGNGTLALTGANSYTGPTAVNAGKLVVTANAIGGGAYAVANGAGLGVNVLVPSAQVNQSSLTLNNSSVDFDLGGLGNPTAAAAPINVAGALGVNGVVTVNVASSLPQLGQFPLIDYSSRAGSGSFVIGSLPLGVSAVIVTNIANSSIDLNVTAVAAPRWNGNLSGVWDIATTPNWIEISTTLPTTYQEGNSVLFNDLATGLTAVSLGVTVNPAKVTVNNTNLSYSIAGNGRIAGATGLLKQGSGALALQTTNDYTGVTRIEGGSVAVTNLANGGVASSIGRASAAPANLALAGGVLSYAGPAVTIDRGYSLLAPNSGFNVAGDLTLSGAVTAGPGSGAVKSGPAKLTYAGAGVKELSGGAFPGYRVENGTLVFDGSAGGQTNHSQNEFWVGNAVDQGAAIVLTNTILNVDSWFSVGRGNGSLGNVSTATLHNSRLRSGNLSMGYDNNIAGNFALQTLTLNGTSSITNSNDMNLGESGGSTSTVLLNNSAILFSDSRIHLGWRGGVGSMTLANSSTVDVDAWFSIGHEGGTGTLLVRDNAKLRILWDMNVTDVGTGSGTMTVQDNAQVVWGSLFVGKGAGSVGVLNQTGGSMLGTDFREAHIGFHGQGTYNLSAGSIVAPSHWFVVGRFGDGPGEFNVTGGTFIHGTNDTGRLFRVGEEGTGVLNLSGTGSISSSGNAVTLGNTGSGNGTINLNGGTLQARRILGGPGAGTFNFNGGLLRVGANPNADFISGLTAANVLAGGAIIDTGTNKVGVNVALLDGGGNGGLTKQGTGALYLNGANTYVGTTLVSAGTLGGNGTIAGPVSVAAGATLAPGTSIGTLTINNTLNLAGTSTTVIEVDKNSNTSDLVTGVSTLTYGGTLVLKNLGGMLQFGNTFNVFDATTFTGSFSSVVSQTPGQTVTWNISQLAVNGTVSVDTAVANPVTLSSVVSGGSLNLSWPANQLGYRLEVQANPLTIGLSNNWVTVPGSTEVTSVSVPVSTTTPTSFYRLVFP